MNFPLTTKEKYDLKSNNYNQHVSLTPLFQPQHILHVVHACRIGRQVT